MHTPTRHSSLPCTLSWRLIESRSRVPVHRPGSVFALLAAIALTALFWALFVV